jgi:F-type H+-transporting ATPase subunit b
MDEKTWFAIVFLSFVFLVFKPVKKALVGMLDQRSEKIRKEIEQALKLKEEAREMLALYERKHKEAFKEADDIIKSARREADMIVENGKKQLEENLKRKLEVTMQRIDQAEAAALSQIQTASVIQALEAARHLIQENISTVASKTVVSLAMDDIKKRLN